MFIGSSESDSCWLILHKESSLWNTEWNLKNKIFPQIVLKISEMDECRIRCECRHDSSHQFSKIENGSIDFRNMNGLLLLAFMKTRRGCLQITLLKNQNLKITIQTSLWLWRKKNIKSTAKKVSNYVKQGMKLFRHYTCICYSGTSMDACNQSTSNR